MQFYVSEVKSNTILELPYIYYSGYEADIYINGDKTKLQTHELNLQRPELRRE